MQSLPIVETHVSPSYQCPWMRQDTPTDNECPVLLQVVHGVPLVLSDLSCVPGTRWYKLEPPSPCFPEKCTLISISGSNF